MRLLKEAPGRASGRISDEPLPGHTEWLETDGRGGFSTGAIDLERRRRYHGLLITAHRWVGDRRVLVASCELSVEVDGARYDLTAQRYASGTLAPTTNAESSFRAEPWPQWTFLVPDVVSVTLEIVMPRGRSATLLRVRTSRPAKVILRPFFTGRRFHDLEREREDLVLSPRQDAGFLAWDLGGGAPELRVAHNGRFTAEPWWYRHFLLEEERNRGFDHTEDLAAPGLFEFDTIHGDAAIIFTVPSDLGGIELRAAPVAVAVRRLLAAERARRRRLSPLLRAAEAYLVDHGSGPTVIAGYPWFGEWGRDTFIAVRGLCLATGRTREARAIVLRWAGALTDGLLPNRFDDEAGAPEYNTVDAALWFVVAAGELLRAPDAVGANAARTLRHACRSVIDSYKAGTRHGIKADDDGLLLAGEAGSQLTWMDARVDGIPITSRRGKPVEVQALWINALETTGTWHAPDAELARRARESFRARFVRPDGQGLYDVVDVDGVAGTVDPSCRPNQIFAVGGLPFSILDRRDARCVVEVVERRLLTPLGLRTLAGDEPGFAARYAGAPHERDAAYHQGTVWPWLMGPFVEAWIRIHGGRAAARKEARRRFFEPFLRRAGRAGIGHVPEVADAEEPHRPGGCPFQAWSVAEALRLELVVLGDDDEKED